MPGVKITACENTAAAAEAVAKSERTDVAAISSYNCVELYGLERLAADIQDRSNNYTRFICISKKLEIYPGADKTSLMLVLPHQPRCAVSDPGPLLCPGDEPHQAGEPPVAGP